MAQFNPGETVNEQYIVKSLLGEGGMNRVYLVQAGTELRALKVSRDPAELGQQYVHSYNQFLKEISILTTIGHSGLPRIYDYFVIGNANCVVEEYIEGQTLEELLRKKRPNLSEVLSWGIALCEILEVLHKNEIIFRDMKPANIMCAKDGTLKLIDFDIARIHKTGKVSDTEVLGTPGYAPPEMYGAAQSDQRADIYSLAATLHQCITGVDPRQKPFQFEPLSIHRKSVPQSLEKAIEKALKKNRDERYATVAEFKKDLIGFAAPAASPVTQYSTVANSSKYNNMIGCIILIVLTVIGAVPYLFTSSDNPRETTQSIAREPIRNSITEDLEPMIIPPDRWKFESGNSRTLYFDTFQYKTEENGIDVEKPSVTINDVLKSSSTPLGVEFSFPVHGRPDDSPEPLIYTLRVLFGVPLDQGFMFKKGQFQAIPGQVLAYNIDTQDKWDGQSENTKIYVTKAGTVKGTISWKPSSKATPLRFWHTPPYFGPMVILILKGPSYGWRYTKSFLVDYGN